MIQDFINSFHFGWYSKFLSKSKIYKLFYLFIFIFLSFLVMLIPLFMKAHNFWNSKDFQNIPNMISDNFPSDFVFTINKDGWSTNKTLPYSIPLNVNNFKDNMKDAKIPANIITFAKGATVDDFAKYDTLVLLTDKSVVTKDQDGKAQISDLTDAYSQIPSEQVIDHARVVSLVNDYWGKIKSFVTGGGAIGILIVCSCLIIGVMFVFGLLYAMLLALIIWVLNMIFKFARSDLSFGSILTTTIFSYGVYAVVDWVMILLFHREIPWGMLVALVLIGVITYMSFPKNQVMGE